MAHHAAQLALAMTWQAVLWLCFSVLRCYTEAIIRKQRHATKKPEEQNLYEQWAPAK
jgi:hypothetical protein